MSRIGTKDNRSYGRLELPEALRKKRETRGQTISTGVEENICHDLRGSSLTGLNKQCFVPPAGNFLP